jgi:hypothetical protein
MAINPNNGVLDIINGTLRVTSLDVKQGSSVSLNALARNNVLLFDDQKSTTTFMPTVAGGYMSSTGVTRNTSSHYLELGTASDEGWVYWPLQLPNAWHTEFDMHVTTTGGVLTFSLFNTSEPNHTDFTNNDGGYKIVFDNTNNQIVIYWEGSVHKTVSIDLRSNDWQHVNVNYSQGATSISLAGKVVLTHEFTQNYQEFNSRYVGFSATAGTSHKIRHLRVHNGDKWLYTKTSNASDITYVSGNVGIGSLAPTELLDVHGNVHIAKDLTVDGNLRVSGTTTFIDSTNLVVEDPIIELAKGNTSDTIDAGLIVTRGASNVAIAFRGDEEELAFGYTQSGASGTDVTPIANGGLDVRVYGNLFANNLTTTANVDASYINGNVVTSNLMVSGEYTMGGRIIPDTNDAYDIGSAEKKIRDLYVADNSLWIGDETKISFSSGKMRFRKRKKNVVPAAILAAGGTATAAKTFSSKANLTDIKTHEWLNYMKTLGGKGNAIMSDVFRNNDDDYEATTAAEAWKDINDDIFSESSVSIGKTSPPTVTLDVEGDGKFSGNVVTTGNIGIRTATPSANLHVMGYQYVNGPPTLANAFDHSDAPLTLTHDTATSSTAINDPKPLLHLTRSGTNNESYGARASFNLSRYENSSTHSRSRLDVALADGTYAESTVMTLRADGKVGVGTDTPAYTLDVAGDINLSGDFYQGGSPFVSSLWTDGTDSLYYRSNVEVGTANLFVDTTTSNVGIGTSTPGYTLDVHGTANVGALTATSISGPLSGNADTATALQTARTIGGESFDGTANIDLPGVNTVGTQNTSGNAATAAALQTARTIGGESFDGTANIDLPGVNTAGTQNTSGNAATAAALQTARTIALTGDVTGSATFDGSGNVSISTTSSEGGVWTSSGTSIYYNSGNVGIGTVSPSAHLHVSSGTSGDCVLKLEADTDNDTETDNARIEFISDGGYNTAVVGAGQMPFSNENLNALVLGAYQTIFYTGVQDFTSNSMVERMRIADTGNVGIGSTNPTRPLTVESSSFDGLRIKRTVAGGGSAMELINGDGDEWTVGVGGTGTFGIYNGATFGEQFTIDASGRVGIGDTTPSYKLSVNGSFRVHGSVATFGSDGLLHINSRSTTHGSETVALQTVIDGRALTDANPGTYGGESRNVLALQPDGGYVGIGTTGPGYKLDVAGDINISSGSVFRINGTALANSATIAASVSAGNSTLVQRHSSGYIFANYFNTTPNDVTSGVTKVCVETGNDGYIRHGTSAAISTFLGLANSATIEATTADTANKIAQRNSSGDIFARLFRSDYQNQSTISGGIAYRVSTSDNYIRFCTDMGAVRTKIGCAAVAGSTSQNFSSKECYVQNWVRTKGNAGHYWESSSNGNGWHIYPKTRADMYFRTGSGSGGIAGTVGNTTVRGYVHWNTSNDIGFLNKDRAWALRMTSDKNCTIFGGLELGTDGKDWGSMTASYNGNIRKNFWIQSTYGGNTSSNYGWWIGTQNQTLSSSDNDLHFICLRNGSATHNGYIQDGSYNVHMNFTGQHRTFVKDTPIQQLQDKEGLIVSADQDEYIRMSGGIAHGSDAITINESLPVVSLSTKSNDKKCFGVLSTTEDPEGRREVHGNFVSNFTKEKGDTRIYVNSVGEGAVWVTNINGNLESGDYITTSNVVGYGMKQDDDILHNYTVAKITMNCDFNPKTIPKKNIKKKLANVDYWVEYATIEITAEEYEALPENERKRGDEDNEDEDKYYKIYKKEIQISDPGDDKHVHEVHEEFVNVLDEHGQLQWEDHPTETEKAYKIRYLTSDGQITDEANAVHIAAFVGCTYHCG